MKNSQLWLIIGAVYLAPQTGPMTAAVMAYIALFVSAICFVVENK